MEEKYFKLKKILDELKNIKGRHTELISLYIPVGYPLTEIQNMIVQEISLTQNVKSKTVRKNVISALTKIQQHLKLYRKTPEHGLAIFCGNVSQREGESNIKLWAIEPPEPVGIKLYWCDQAFELKPLMDMIKEKEVYGLVVMDLRDAAIGILKGKRVQLIKHLESIVPGKERAGGQSAARFERVREGMINDWYKKIAENIKSSFGDDVKGIIIGGPGPAKDRFIDGGYLPEDVKKNVLGVVSIGYSGEEGLHELVNRSMDIISEAAISREKAVMERFLTELYKDSGLATYGLDFVIKALEMGAVETLLLSEKFDMVEAELVCSCGYSEKKLVKKGEKVKCPKCGAEMKVISEKDVLDFFEDLAERYDTKIEVISTDTKEGQQLLALGGIGAILRWKVE